MGRDVYFRTIKTPGPRVRQSNAATKTLRFLAWGGLFMFTQILDPTGNLFVTWLVALIPVVLLLFLLAGLRMSAWLAVLIGSIVTFLLGLWGWEKPVGGGLRALLF